MNIDVVSTFDFGNAEALRDFLLVHRFVHEAEAAAFQAQFGVAQGIFGLSGAAAEEAWAAMMQAGERVATPPALQDWLQLHATMHVEAYSLLGSSPQTAPDLSQVDFSSPEDFYDWMSAHQEMHDFEQQALGLS